MTQHPNSDRTTDGMVDYDRNSLGQKQDALRNSDMIFDLAQRVASLPGALNITDFGCGPGQSAIDTVLPALQAWKSVASTAQISVCHADQPGNDWNALMRLVFGETGYAGGSSPPLVMTAAGSFFDRMVPVNSVSLATCFAASHWLSAPYKVLAPDTVWFADLPETAHRQMWQAARQDWANFLKLRAQELKAGGYLFVSTLGAIPDASEPNGIAASGRGLYRAFEAVTTSMTTDGLLDKKTSDSFVFGLWFLTEDEAGDVFKRDEALAEAFEIEMLKVGPKVEGGDIYSDDLHNPTEYAKRYAGFAHAFASTTLRHQLFGPSSGSEDDVDRLEREFFHRLEVLYREKTNFYAFEQWHLRVVLKRK